MSKDVQFIVDNMGNKTSVIIPFSQWEKQNEKYNLLKKKLDVFIAIKEGIEEVRKARKSGKELKSLNEFLDDC